MNKPIRPSVLNVMKDLDSIEDDHEAFSEMIDSVGTMLGNFSSGITPHARAMLWDAIGASMSETSTLKATMAGTGIDRRERNIKK